MKRLLLSFALLLAVPAAFAQSNGNVVLTEKGTLYTASMERADEHPEANAESATYIVLTVRQPDAATRRLIVPSTLSAGWNAGPTLAYNDDTETVYVFWQYMTNVMSSELKFISLDRDGNWSAPATFENAVYRMRRNLRIALTHKTRDTNEAGEITYLREVNVHATWWEESGASEGARYAMLSFGPEGEVSVHVHDLSSFANARVEEPFKVDEKFNREILRHPAIFESAGGDSVDVVFGNVELNALHRITVGVIAQSRIRIPIGIADSVISAPSRFAISTNAQIDAISPYPDRIVYYFEKDGAMNYIVHRDNEWSGVRTIVLGDDVTRETAVGAIRRFVGVH